MTNEMLKATVKTILTGKVREDARIEYTQHGNGYCVCIRIPHTNHMTGRTEYSLPATFNAWGIQTERGIHEVIEEFLHYNQHLVA